MNDGHEDLVHLLVMNHFAQKTLAGTFALTIVFSVIVTAADVSPKKLKPPTAAKDSGSIAKEEAWTDGRVNQTDIGQFFSSTVRLPHQFVAKGLSVRIGNNNDGAVCYDTASCNLRGAWTGKFLQFVPARYGLIQSPKPAGEIQFLNSGDAWKATPRYRGLHLHENRVVLAYEVGQTSVLESPWLETSGGLTIFTRTFELGESKDKQITTIGELKESQARTNQIEGVSVVILERGAECEAFAVTGGAEVKLFAIDNQIRLEIAPHQNQTRCKVLQWKGPVADLTKFAAATKKSSAPEDLRHLTEPGSARCAAPLITKGEIAVPSNEPYVVDTISVPYDNPYRALMFLSGVDFLSNDDAVVCTIHGDVWLVHGIDDKLQKVEWKRFATGLFQPLGLKVVNDGIYVLGRDQITRLHDGNHDGEADFYETFYNGINTSEGGHDYVTSLETDPDGNFYYVDPIGLHRISRDAIKHETLATGWRNPNGMGVSPDGVITVAPQEGHWTPSSAICEVKRGGFYGMGGPQITSERPLGYDAPLCWIPRMIDNSSGSQVWATSDKWGPLKNQMLSLSFGRCSMMLVLRETVEGIPQGGVLTLKPHFLSGAMRGTFRKSDGQLYVVGSLGWSTSATRDGCLQRVRYTGKKAYLPVALNVFTNGIQLGFSEPLERETAEDTGSYGIEQWNYLYSQDYGSKEYSVSQPKEVGHDSVDIKSARLSKDGRSVFLEIADLKPVMQMEIQYNVNSADGKTVRGEIYNTINKLRAAPGTGLQ